MFRVGDAVRFNGPACGYLSYGDMRGLTGKVLEVWVNATAFVSWSTEDGFTWSDWFPTRVLLPATVK